jgi:phosphoglycolate phosphatase-like HAD superfamily hydrolase
MKHLILFDVDGTLLRCGKQVGFLFVEALKEVFGGYGKLEGYSFAGKTDPRIVVDMIRATGRDEEEILLKLPAMRRLYLDKLERGLRRDGMRLFPGVQELLERLSARDDVLIGLLTGNWRRGAKIKLSRFDLNRYFAFGAFGDDAIDRRDLVPVALERAAALCGERFEPRRTMIVGDTELDVDCARSAGAWSMAVATGFTAAERLEAAGADWVFPDLESASRQFEQFVG